MSQELQAPLPSPVPPLSEILDAHSQLEIQVGQIYLLFAATFRQNPELWALWGMMALEEGGHAALARVVRKGLLAGGLHDKCYLLPLEILDSLTTQVAEYRRQAEAGVSLEQALRITWEIECSELEFLRELFVSSSNLADLGFPTVLDDPDKDAHVGRLRQIIHKYTTDKNLRREVMFLSLERSPQ